uniref:Modulator of non-genomic activity of estrogen receptor n=1 Tax=Oryzias latipes TaxID=8090 RepID=A0A3P9HWU3_ORYLA
MEIRIILFSTYFTDMGGGGGVMALYNHPTLYLLFELCCGRDCVNFPSSLCLRSLTASLQPPHTPTLTLAAAASGLSIQNDVAGLVGFSNAKLSSSKTRFEGLCLLSVLVKDSSSDLFQQHCLFWLRSLQQIIQSQAPVQTVQLAVNILKDLLQYSSHLAELAREVGLNSILGILTSLLGLKTECELAAMEGMVACMLFYPRACGSLKDKLGAYFLSKMDSNNMKTQEMACLCYSHLPCLGGLLDRAISAGKADGWTNQIHCLLATADALLTQIYKGSEPGNLYGGFLVHTCIYFTFLCWSVCELRKVFFFLSSSVRVSVYKTLELWVKVVGASVSILQENPMHADLLFSNLLGDITPGPESIKFRAGLGVDVVPGGKPGPRRTKHLVIADPMGPSLQRKGDPLSNQDTCLAALRDHQSRLLVVHWGSSIAEVVMTTELSSDKRCRKHVGSVCVTPRLLLALVLVPSPSWPPPLTCAVSIFSNGRTDRNLKVSSFCAEALTICNTMVHPRTPSIALPLPPPHPQTPHLCPGALPSGVGSQANPADPPGGSRSLENHLSTVPGLPAQGPTPGDMFSPHRQHDSGLGLPESQRPVFVRFDKEEPDDVEISLASDSDDSVVIVPPGMINLDQQQDEAAANVQTMLSATPAGGRCGDSAIININSTDDEDEEEDLEDDEELEEEEEDGLDEEDEEEGSEDFYDGEEYEDYDEEEGEELEEEEEEEEEEIGDMPPLEGSEEKLVDAAIEEGQVLHPAADDKEPSQHHAEADSERGIQELQPQRTSERMDDPTMPQIICVSGGAQESVESGDEGGGTTSVLQEDRSRQAAKEEELEAAAEEQAGFRAEVRAAAETTACRRDG